MERTEMTKFERVRELPDLPSDVLSMALTDLEAVERDPRYEICMLSWHDYYESTKKCAVCLAGALMVGMGLPHDADMGDEENGPFRPREWSMFYMINEFRRGHLHQGLRDVAVSDGARELVPRMVQVVPYVSNPEKFREQMRGIVETLRAAGL